MKVDEQFEALNNAVRSSGRSELKVHIHHQNDARRKVPKFFLTIGQTYSSPVLDYNTMNHFILGLSVGVKMFGPTSQ